jgi:hypothetical protein
MADGPAEWPLLPRDGGSNPAVPPSRRQAAGYGPDDPLRLTAMWSKEVRRGRWLVPPYVTVAPVMSNILLDLRDAVADAPTVRVIVEGIAGNVILVIPEGWGVDTDRLRKGLGSIRNRIGPLAVPGYPLVVVSGTIGLGTFVARRERFFERWGRASGGSGQGPRELLR